MKLRTIVLSLVYFSFGGAILVFGWMHRPDRAGPGPSARASAYAKVIAADTAVIGSDKADRAKLIAAYQRRGSVYYVQGKTDQALSDFRARLKLEPPGSPGAAVTHRWLSLVYRRRHDYVAALAEYNRSQDGKPATATAYLVRAAIHLEAKDFSASEHEADAAIRLKPEAVQGYYLRSRIREARGDHAGALADLDAVAKLAPAWNGVHDARAAIYLHAWDLVPAVREWWTGFRSADADRKLVGLKFRAEREAHALNFVPAIADFSRYLAHQPQDAQARLDRADLYLWSGQQAKAFADYRAVLKAHPDLADAHSYYADAQFAVFRFADALSQYDRALALSKNPAPILRNRGTSEFALGRYAKAAADFEAALKHDPHAMYAAVWLHLARMRLHIHDKAQLAEQMKDLPQTRWPYPVLQYFAGGLDADDLARAAGDTVNADTRRDQSCEADYYTAMVQWQHGRRNPALLNFHSAARHCHPGFIEHTMARWALKQADSGG